MLLIVNVSVPSLKIAVVRSRRLPTLTPLNSTDDMGSRISGMVTPVPEAVKETLLSSGSLELTVKVALLAPGEDGENLTVTVWEPPAGIVNHDPI